MTKEKRGYFFALFILFSGAFIMFALQPVRVARPLVQWELHPLSPQVDAPVPNRHYMGNLSYGSVRIDAAGNFYFLVKRENTLFAVAANSDGQEIRRFPLHRKDGRPIRIENHDLAVNQAGTRLWIFRRPVEDMVGRYSWSIPYRIMAVYDLSGKLLQEWKFPGMDQATALQAVGNDSAYLGHEGDPKTSIYRIGVGKRQVVNLYAMYYDYLNSQGQVWGIEAKNEAKFSESRNYGLTLKTAGRTPREKYTLKMRAFEGPKEVFWQENGADVYFSTYRVDQQGRAAQNFWPLIYRASPRGVECIFDSGRYLTTIEGKKGKRYKTGKIIKANSAGTVWMEVMEKDGFEKKRTYGIIKFETVPRWRSWL